MRNLLFILLLVPLNLFSQEYPKVDTLNFGKHVKEAFLHQHYYNKKDTTLLQKYVFNDEAQHIYTYDGYNYQVQERIKFEYENGQLVKILKHTYRSSVNDSIEEELWQRYYKILGKGDNLETEREADSLYRAYKSKYEFIDPETVKWKKEGILKSELEIQYSSQGKPITYQLYTASFNKPPRLEMIVEMVYNDTGRLKSKTWKDIDYQDTFKFNAFKPNSLELNDSIKVLSGNIKRKQYFYNNNLVSIQYFVNDKQTGLEEVVYNPAKQEKLTLVMNLAGDTLSYHRELYDKTDKLIKRNNLKYIGCDGFGYISERVVQDEKRYFYNENGSKSHIIEYYDKKKYSISTYKY